MRIRCTNPWTSRLFNPSFMDKPITFDRRGFATVTEEVGKKAVEYYGAVEAVTPPKPKRSATVDVATEDEEEGDE